MSDLRDGLRMLRSNPGVSILAATALALGIGSTTTMYSITRGILRDLPVDRPEQLMHVAMTDRNAGDDYLRIPAADIIALREQATTALLEQLDRLDDAEPRWSWWPPEQTVGFTRRMQIHEATMHRVDAELLECAPRYERPVPARRRARV
jgi:hypothetical protein